MSIAEIADDLKAWRRDTRKRLIAARMAIPGHDRDRFDAGIAAHIGQLTPAVGGKCVGFCWPYMGEFDARPVVAGMLARGARAALPIVVAPKTPLLFREWHLEAPMSSDAYGIPIPAQGMPQAHPDFVLLPMNGFDAGGYRLGYGGGFFDRTLAALSRRPIVIGISYELGRLDCIRPEAHDIPMDFVVTEMGAYRRSATRLEPFDASSAP